MTNNFYISIPISGLIRTENYSYNIVGVGGNWPAIASPSSGSFVASSRSSSISTMISFLPTTGFNNDNSLDYNLTLCGYENKDLYTNVMAEISSTSDNTTILSQPVLVRCSGCLPQIAVSISGCGAESCEQYYLENENIFNLVSNISGLEPNTKYKYNIKSDGSNWPVIMITPSGGDFQPTSNTYQLQHKLMFCPYSNDLCGDNVLNYDLTQCFNRNNLYCNLQLSISPEYCEEEKFFSNNILVNCKDCLPKTNISLPSKILLTSSNIVSITGSLSGLIPNTVYNYNFASSDSNWPAILKPIRGTFVASDSVENIVVKFGFCYPSGNCNGPIEGLLPYSIDSLALRDFNENKLYNRLILQVDTFCGDSLFSNDCLIECENCLPCIKYANAIFDDSPTIILENSCCQGQKLIKVNINNAIPGEKYTYKFNYSNSLGFDFVQFNPATGEVYFGSGGNGSVSTICAVNLSNFSQSLIDFELTHYNTNSKVSDTVGLICNTGSCF